MSEKIECLKIDGRNYPLCRSCGWVEAEKSTMAFREGCHCVHCEKYIIDAEGNTANAMEYDYYSEHDYLMEGIAMDKKFNTERKIVTTLELLELIESKKITIRIYADNIGDLEVHLNRATFRRLAMKRFGTIQNWYIVVREDDVLLNHHIEINHNVLIWKKQRDDEDFTSWLN